VRTAYEQSASSERTTRELRANYARTAYEQRANYERELTRELRDAPLCLSSLRSAIRRPPSSCLSLLSLRPRTDSSSHRARKTDDPSHLKKAYPFVPYNSRSHRLQRRSILAPDTAANRASTRRRRLVGTRSPNRPTFPRLGRALRSHATKVLVLFQRLLLPPLCGDPLRGAKRGGRKEVGRRRGWDSPPSTDRGGYLRDILHLGASPAR
jgi:hypothetical protein